MDEAIEVYNGADFKVINDEIWATQKDMATAFDATKQDISYHVKDVLQSGELQEDEVVKEFLTTAPDGKNYMTKHYNLDMIIAVGFRVKSSVGTAFRIWANGIIKKYTTQGVVVHPDYTNMKKSELFRLLSEAEAEKEKQMLLLKEKDDAIDHQDSVIRWQNENLQKYAEACNTFCPIGKYPPDYTPRRGTFVKPRKKKETNKQLKLSLGEMKSDDMEKYDSHTCLDDMTKSVVVTEVKDDGK